MSFLSPYSSSFHISASIRPPSLLFLNHDASRWRWGWDLGAVAALAAATEGGREEANVAAPPRAIGCSGGTGCVACARRIFGTRVTSPARVATAHIVSVTQSHTPLASPKLLLLVRRRYITWIHSETGGTVG